MRQSIRAAAKQGAENIAVVCGAWHAPALAEPGPGGARPAHAARAAEGQGRGDLGAVDLRAAGARRAATARASTRRPGTTSSSTTPTIPVARWLARAARLLRARRAWTRPPRRSSTPTRLAGALAGHPRPPARRPRRAARRHPRRALPRLRRPARARPRASWSSATGSARSPTTRRWSRSSRTSRACSGGCGSSPRRSVEGAHARPAARERPRAQPAAAPPEPARGAVGRRPVASARRWARSRRRSGSSGSPALALDLIHAGRWGTTVEAAAAAPRRAREAARAGERRRARGARRRGPARRPPGRARGRAAARSPTAPRWTATPPT